MNKRQRLERDIQAISQKIETLQEKQEALQLEYQQLLDMEILQAVHSVTITPEELKQAITAFQKSPVSPIFSSFNEDEEEKEKTIGKEDRKP